MPFFVSRQEIVYLEFLLLEYPLLREELSCFGSRLPFIKYNQPPEDDADFSGCEGQVSRSRAVGQMPSGFSMFWGLFLEVVSSAYVQACLKCCGGWWTRHESVRFSVHSAIGIVSANLDSVIVCLFFVLGQVILDLELFCLKVGFYGVNYRVRLATALHYMKPTYGGRDGF